MDFKKNSFFLNQLCLQYIDHCAPETKCQHLELPIWCIIAMYYLLHSPVHAVWLS